MTNISTQNKVKIVTDENFEDTVNSNSFIIIDCWAPWCGPCRMLSPIIEELSEEYQDNVAFGKLNVDENSKVSQEFRIASIPTLLFFKNGKHVDTLIGAVPKSTIVRKIQALA